MTTGIDSDATGQPEGQDNGARGAPVEIFPAPGRPVIIRASGRPAASAQYRTREHRRRRMRRHGRKAYIRSVYFLPSLATLGNAVCGFGAMYIATLNPHAASPDVVTNWFAGHRFVVAAYLIFLAMIFDALDGRLARFTRHTTDFGGQLDSLSDVISFGAAPAFLALQVFKDAHPDLPPTLTRLIWAVAALYMSCAAIRLARFNVSNEHGEQHHYSFLGLPSPGAGGAVAAFILMQQELAGTARDYGEAAASRLATLFSFLSELCLWLLPVVVLVTGVLMISTIRYPHFVNRYLKGRRSIWRVVMGVVLVLLVIVAHRYVLGIATLAYTLIGVSGWAWRLFRPKPAPAEPRPA